MGAQPPVRCALMWHIGRTSQTISILANLVGNGVARRLVESLPGFNQALQINVKRCQELTLEALEMQRICSAALLAILAIAYAVFSCDRIRGRFDSRSVN
jgi:hypothetical protein